MSRSLLRARVSGVALVLLALAAASCGRKSITPPGDGVEGLPSASQLVVYPDIPVRAYLFDDLRRDSLGNVVGGVPNCSEDDTLLSYEDLYATGQGVVNGTIFDYTVAGAFEIFREEGATFRPLLDHAVEPTRRYFDGHTDLFRFSDRPPVPSQGYLARGVVDGKVTASSPKTNVARVTAGISPSITYLNRTNICGDTPGFGEIPPDSLLDLAWSAVPGAAGYWVQVFQFGGNDFLANVFPQPAFAGESSDFLLAYFPSTVTAYKLGDAPPVGARILTSRSMINNIDVAVRISAVDANGQLIAYTGDTRAYVVIPFTSVDPDAPETQYIAIRLSAYVVHPGSPAACGPGCPAPTSTGLPTVRVFREAALPAALR